jgi:tetratricopeptide (TPR) repeat protein
MSHPTVDALKEALQGEVADDESRRLAQHLAICPSCRALAGSLAIKPDGAQRKRENPLENVVQIAEAERLRTVESLTALAVWAEVKSLPSKSAQRDRVIQSPTCHTRTFFEALLSDLRSVDSLDQSELLGNLALLAVQGMDGRKYSAKLKNDLLAEVWIEVGNARRIGAEWVHATTALKRADQHLKAGTGKPALLARSFSIAAALRADQGHRSEAVDILEGCRDIYADLRDWPLVARTLVQAANILTDVEPLRGLSLLDEARPLIPAEDSVLSWFAESIRTECLIESGQITLALAAFSKAQSLRELHGLARSELRNRFTAGRLLEALGRFEEAERLFEHVAWADLEQERYRDSFLDLLYLFGFHIRAGSPAKAAEVCRRALTHLERLDFVHDQLRVAWERLLDGVTRQAIDRGLLFEARDYLRVHWKHPAREVPDFMRGKTHSR